MINFFVYFFLIQVKSLNLQLFTTRHCCRQCLRFKRKYSNLKIKYPDVNFETLDIRENMEIAKKAKIYRIPFILFDEGIEDKDRILCVPRNYDTIEDRCKESNVNYSDSSPCSNNNP